MSFFFTLPLVGRVASNSERGGVLLAARFTPPRLRSFHSRNRPSPKRGGIRSGHASSPAFFDRPRAGRIPKPSFHRPLMNEGARNAGVRTTPQVCARCCNKKCTGYPRSAGFPGVPRAVFIGLLRSAPGGLTLLSTAAGRRRVRRRDFPIGRLSRTLVSSSLRRADASIPLAQAPLSQ